MARALGKRAAQDIEALPLLVELRAEVDRQIHAAAVALHTDTDEHPGHSWTELGRVLGITRQAAFQRFGGGDTPTE